MTKKKIIPWIFPDRSEEVEPGVFAYLVIYGYEGPGGLHPVGDLHRVAGVEAREKHALILGQKLQAARGGAK